MRYIVIKNTLPYIYQWAIIDTSTNNKIGEYKHQQTATEICDFLNNNSTPLHIKMQKIIKYNDTLDAMEKRIKQANIEPKPWKPNRKIELD